MAEIIVNPTRKPLRASRESSPTSDVDERERERRRRVVERARNFPVKGPNYVLVSPPMLPQSWLDRLFKKER